MDSPSPPRIHFIANLWTLTGHPSEAGEWTLEEKVKAISEAGFDGVNDRGRPELMQSTISEHRVSPFAEVSCTSCHMPVVETPTGRHRSHAFASSRDPRALRATLDVEASRSKQGLLLRVTPGAVGHAIPTGDLFRRLRIEVEHLGPDMNLIEVKRRFLARHFENRPSAHSLGRTVVRDDRPGGVDAGHETQVFEFAFPGLKPKHALAWRIEHERVLHPAPGGDAAAVVAHRQVIAEGKR